MDRGIARAVLTGKGSHRRQARAGFDVSQELASKSLNDVGHRGWALAFARLEHF
jgi:hypothetical protein